MTSFVAVVAIVVLAGTVVADVVVPVLVVRTVVTRLGTVRTAAYVCVTVVIEIPPGWPLVTEKSFENAIASGLNRGKSTSSTT